MLEEDLLWSAGRDLALLRRCANPAVPQTETFNNMALLRRLFLEGAIHAYWKRLRPEAGAKLQIEYSYVRTGQVDEGDYLLVLTGDQLSDLLLGGNIRNPASLYQIHARMISGLLADHLNASIVIASEKFQFTPVDIIKYHAYTLGEVHLNTTDRVRVQGYDALLRQSMSHYPVSFGSNGPSSLALKGFLNRVTRSDAFRWMFQKLSQAGYVPADVEFPAIDPLGLKEQLRQGKYDAVVISLMFTQRAVENRLPDKFPNLAG